MFTVLHTKYRQCCNPKPSGVTGKTLVNTASLGSFPSYTSCFYTHLPALQFGLLMFSWMLVTADGCCRELHEENKKDFSLFVFFSLFFPWDRNERLFSAYIVPTVTDTLGTSRYQQPLELQLQQCQGLSSQGGPQERPAQQAPFVKCWFNLYMPRIFQDSHLQQQAQSLPLASGPSQDQVLQMRPEMLCVPQPWGPEAPSLSSAAPLAHLSGPARPFFQAFPAQCTKEIQLRAGVPRAGRDRGTAIFAQPHLWIEPQESLLNVITVFSDIESNKQ